MSGTVQLAKGQTQAWMLIHAGNRWYPGPGPVRADGSGRFTQQIFVGAPSDPASTVYELDLVTVSQHGADVLGAYRQREDENGVVRGLTDMDVTTLDPQTVQSVSVHRS